MTPMRVEPDMRSAGPAARHLELAASRTASVALDAERQSPQSTSPRPSLILRVLTGAQARAQARIRHQRLLVGNIEAECDVVLDVGHAQPCACLVRVSSDGWTVLAIAGDLWVGSEWVAPQQTRDIASGDVLTLGDVAFCIANTATVDWAQVKVPTQRQPARSAPGTSSAPMSKQSVDDSMLGGVKRTLGLAPPVKQASSPASSQRRSAGALLKSLLLAIAFLVVLALAGGLAYLALVPPPAVSPTVNAEHLLQDAKAVVAGFSWAREVTVQTDQQGAGRVLLGGYVPERTQGAALEAALLKKGIPADHRWTAVDEFKPELAQRLGFSGVTPGRLRYLGQGRFMVSDTSANLAKIDPLIRRVLQDLPHVKALDLRLLDQVREQGNPEEGVDGGSPVILHYTRSDGVTGGIAVAGLELLKQEQKWQYDVRELRLGSLSSIVLSDGARYFEGSSLPGGAVLLKIRARHLVIRQGQETRQIELSADVPLADKSPLRSSSVDVGVAASPF